MYNFRLLAKRFECLLGHDLPNWQTDQPRNRGLKGPTSQATTAAEQGMQLKRLRKYNTPVLDDVPRVHTSLPLDSFLSSLSLSLSLSISLSLASFSLHHPLQKHAASIAALGMRLLKFLAALEVDLPRGRPPPWYGGWRKSCTARMLIHDIADHQNPGLPV